MKAKPVRVALAGVGAISQVVHLPILADRSDVELVALADLDQAKAKTIAHRYGVPRVATDAELLADDSIDALVLCTPNHQHEDLAVRAMAAGKHLLVERPLALTAAGVERVIEAAKVAGKTLQVGLPHRHRPDALALHSFVAGGELGPVYSVRASTLNRKLPLPKATWRQRRIEAGGGALMDLGVALADLALWLIGYPEVKRVSAVTSTGDYEVEDAASLVAETVQRHLAVSRSELEPVRAVGQVERPDPGTRGLRLAAAPGGVQATRWPATRGDPGPAGPEGERLHGVVPQASGPFRSVRVGGTSTRASDGAGRADASHRGRLPLGTGADGSAPGRCPGR